MATVIKKLTNKYYDAMYSFGQWLEYTVAYYFIGKAVAYFRDYCKYCGYEGGYGHDDSCPRRRPYNDSTK